MTRVSGGSKMLHMNRNDTFAPIIILLLGIMLAGLAPLILTYLTSL